MSSKSIENTVRFIEIPKEYWDAKLLHLLYSVDLDIYFGTLFSRPSHTVQSIHTDGEAFAKINFVYNGEGSLMHWYQPKVGVQGKIVTMKNGDFYTLYDKNECTRVWSVEPTSIGLTNAGVPHNVENNTNKQRWCISYHIQLRNSRKFPAYEDVRERLSSWIKQ